MGVKVCRECSRINHLDVEQCIECGGKDFDELELTPFWDSIEPYEEERN